MLMVQITQLNGKDKQLYRLVAPLVMDSEVLRANNNYPYKTGEKFVWFVATNKKKEVVAFVPVEKKSQSRGVINNYYVRGEDGLREEILSELLLAVLAEFTSDKWLLNSITLIQDKETFEKSGFIPLENNYKKYVKMYK